MAKSQIYFGQLHLAVSEQQWYFFPTVLVFPVAFQFKNKAQCIIHIYLYIIQIVHIVNIYIYIAYKYTCYIILQYVIILRHIHIAYKYIDL